jgi:heme-degrading monooxygenase HmoA
MAFLVPLDVFSEPGKNDSGGDMTQPTQRSLFAVVFEVKPNPTRMDDYLRVASGLRPELIKVPGFLENERFRSRSRPGVLLSLSLWDDEKALVRWRVMEKHHEAQMKGREGIFEDYHLRVGEVTYVTGPFADRKVGWVRQDATEVGQAKTLTIIDGVLSPPLWQFVEATVPGRPSAVSYEIYDHLTTHGRSAIVVGWNSLDDANGFAKELTSKNTAQIQIYTIRIIRDYGLKDRREAPQFYK